MANIIQKLKNFYNSFTNKSTHSEQSDIQLDDLDITIDLPSKFQKFSSHENEILKIFKEANSLFCSNFQGLTMLGRPKYFYNKENKNWTYDRAYVNHKKNESSKSYDNDGWFHVVEVTLHPGSFISSFKNITEHIVNLKNASDSQIEQCFQLEMYCRYLLIQCMYMYTDEGKDNLRKYQGSALENIEEILKDTNVLLLYKLFKHICLFNKNMDISPSPATECDKTVDFNIKEFIKLLKKYIADNLQLVKEAALQLKPYLKNCKIDAISIKPCLQDKNYAKIKLKSDDGEITVSEFLKSDFCKQNGISRFDISDVDKKFRIDGFVNEEGVRHYRVLSGSLQIILNWQIGEKNYSITLCIIVGTLILKNDQKLSREEIETNTQVKIAVAQKDGKDLYFNLSEIINFKQEGCNITEKLSSNLNNVQVNQLIEGRAISKTI
ncbi:hypothetical protein [Wolbachia endosymbiont of Pentidionis agamae]|uniref:hypothetical protein n=1 Tax=Wolbachia endosymbiont of Pentidionis agamae TaxID=3110435 RepID=UPI002FD1C357